MHEAGHLTALLASRFDLRRATIVRGKHDEGHVSYRGVLGTPAHAMVALAGDEAERLRWGFVGFPDSKDAREARRIAQELSNDAETVDARLETLRRDTRELLASRWQLLNAIAEDLEHRQTLGPKRLKHWRLVSSFMYPTPKGNENDTN